MGSLHLDSKYNNPELFISGLTESNHVVLLFKEALIFGVLSYKLKQGVKIILNGMTICQLCLQMIHHFQYSIVKL